MQRSPRRSTAFTLAGAALAGTAAAAGSGPTLVQAHDLRPTDPAYRFDEYEAIVNRDLAFRQAYEWPILTNPSIYVNISNGLNAFQFAYGAAPEQIQVVVLAYATAIGALNDDFIWQRYRLGEAFGVKDPATGQPAVRNPWLASKLAAPEVTPPPADRAHAFYADTSVEGLQRRGVLFLACHQSIHGQARGAVADGRNPDNLTEAQLADEIQAHLIPGALLVPAAVGELVRLQAKGYGLVVNH